MRTVALFFLSGVTYLPLAPRNPGLSSRRGRIVQFEVFDILDRRVVLLGNGTMETGTHSVTWHADAASGVYFYRLHVLNSDARMIFDRVRRTILLR